MSKVVAVNSFELWAHPPSPKNTKPHLLVEHSLEVARIASELAEPFGGEDFAYVVGLLHDIGKATENFQRRLRGLDHVQPARHPRIGALVAQLFQGEVNLLAAYIIDHHHGGFYDYHEFLSRMSNDSIPPEWVAEAKKFLHSLIVHDPSITAKLTKVFSGKVPVSKEELPLYLRMIHSCLIESDRRDTQMHGEGLNEMPLHLPDWNKTHNSVESYYKILSQKALANPSNNTSILNSRNTMAAEALSKASLPPGLYSLEMPTGAGKTLTGARWMATHALHHNMSRLIYVAPYIAILDQSEEEFRKFYGAENVLVHHSNFSWENISNSALAASLEKKFKDSVQNWNSPVIITTTVQLLESLFSSQCSGLRKLHNIVGSVIMIDEFQSIPTELIAPTYQRLEDLCTNYGCTVILTSATSNVNQLESYGLVGKVTRLIDDPYHYQDTFKRADLKAEFTQVGWESILDRVQNEHQVMVITTMKKGCAKLRYYLEDRDEDHIFHLSTSMVPSYRKATLDKVRERLKKGQKVWLFCTPTVEAGVDIDFPVVFKQRAPYDSVEQARGRCNREGKMKGKGKVVLYSINNKDEELLLSPSWRQKWDTTYHAIKQAEDGLDRIDLYYEKVFNQGDPTIFDRPYEKVQKGEINSILELERRMDLKLTNDAYQIIKDGAVSIPVMGLGVDVLQILSKDKLSKEDWNKLQSVSVTMYGNRIKTGIENGHIRTLDNDVKVWSGKYDPKWGILPYEIPMNEE